MELGSEPVPLPSTLSTPIFLLTGASRPCSESRSAPCLPLPCTNGQVAPLVGTSATRKAPAALRGPPAGPRLTREPYCTIPPLSRLCLPLLLSWRLLPLPSTHLNKAFRFSGSSVRPAYPGFMVMKMPMVGMRLIISPRKLNFFFLARMASWTHFTYTIGTVTRQRGHHQLPLRRSKWLCTCRGPSRFLSHFLNETLNSETIVGSRAVGSENAEETACALTQRPQR